MHRFDIPPPPAPPGLRWQAALIFAACATAYFLTRTPALDEWDSVQFALGVGDFDLWRHQPHPPGYPLYIALGWLASHGLPLDAPNALQLVSALGSGLFVACWFALVARHFGRAAGWTVAAALGTLLITWMSATKVLSDPLATGLLSLTLLLADRCRRVFVEPPAPRLAAMALAGAAAVGARPQNFGVVLLIVCVAAAACRPLLPLPRGRRWAIALGVLLGGCLLWLVPTAWTQAHAPESHGDAFAYPHQLLAQWRWRLDQPRAFIAASGGDDPAENRWLYRLEHHPLGWLTRGFGFALGSSWGWLGIAVLAAGWARYFLLRGREDGAFWRAHLPWAAAYVGMVFCFLPGDQRYYLPIFPLLILTAVLGWRGVEASGHGWLGALVPVATLAASLPFIGPNHTEAAPPVRMIRWLDAKYPPIQRGDVLFFVHDAYRHAVWYAPDFRVVALTDPTAPPELLPDDPQHVAAYTDDPAFVARYPAGQWKQVAAFQRSPLIYRKHSASVLYERRRTKNE